MSPAQKELLALVAILIVGYAVVAVVLINVFFAPEIRRGKKKP